MGATVALDDEPPLDEEVDPTDAADTHLRLVPRAESAEDEAYVRLRPGLGRAVHEISQPPIPSWQLLEDQIDLVIGDQSEVQCAIDRRDPGAWPLAHNGLRQRLEQIRVQVTASGDARSPVGNHTGRSLRQPARFAIELDVEPSTIQDEDAEKGEKGNAIQPPT